MMFLVAFKYVGAVGPVGIFLVQIECGFFIVIVTGRWSDESAFIVF